MTRRFVTTKGARWIVACTLSVSMLLGATLTAGAQPRAARHTAAAPASGGSFTFWGSAPTTCVDPQTGQGAGGLGNYVFDTLFTTNEKGKIQGDLGTSYKLSKGGKVVTVQLRQGVKFSNGDPFNAAAVKYTFQRAADPATKSPLSAQVAGIAGIQPVGKTAVQFTLKAPSRTFITETLVNIVLIDPKSPPSCTSVVGTGPYKYTDVASDFTSMTAVANKHHTWAPAWIRNKGVPYITTIHYKLITNAETAVSSAFSGDLDYLFNVPNTQLSRFQGNSQFKIYPYSQPAAWIWEFNNASPPFNTLPARKALAELVDRNAIVKAAFGGAAKPGYSIVPPNVPDHDPTADKLTPHYNPTDAAKLIQQYHLTGPYRILTLPDPQDAAIAQIVQASAAQVGMKIDIVNKGFSDWLAAANGGQFEATYIGWGYGTDPDAMYTIFHSSQCCGKGYSWDNFKNSTFDNYIVKGRNAPTLKKAKPYYYKAQEIYAKQVAGFNIVVPKVSIVLRSTIKGFHSNTQGVVAIQDLYIKTKK